MSVKRDLKMHEKFNGKNFVTTISYVNPAASAADLTAFVKKLNALTKNTYVDTLQIDETKLSEVTA